MFTGAGHFTVSGSSTACIYAQKPTLHHKDCGGLFDTNPVTSTVHFHIFHIHIHPGHTNTYLYTQKFYRTYISYSFLFYSIFNVSTI